MNTPYRTALLLATVLLLVAVMSAGASAKAIAAPFPDQRDSAKAAVDWLLQEKQNEDGGFGSVFPSGEPASTVSSTVDAILAMSAAGFSADEAYFGNQKSAVDYLKDNMADVIAFAAVDGGSNGKVILALSAANKNARAFPVHNYVAQLINQYDQASGTYNNNVAYSQALSILALAAVAEPLPEKALTWLEDLQAGDGSWADGFGTARNADATALAVMALIAGGRDTTAPSVAAALTFLADSQLASGGWEYGAGYGENANSTALVVQALSAAGEDFYDGAGKWAKNGVSPLMALLAWQAGNGAFQADFGQGRFDDFFAAAQAVPAVTGKPYPLPSRYEAVQAAVLCLSTLQDEESGQWEQFAGFGANAGGTSRAIEAIAASAARPQSARWTPGEHNAVEALETGTGSYIDGYRGGRLGIVLQGVAAAGAPYDGTDFAGVNLPRAIHDSLDENGEYADTAFGISSHAEAMLGLLAAGEGVDPEAVNFLLGAQTGGDWGTADQNGIALNALGRLGESVPMALGKLRSAQLADGGWGFAPASNPSSSSEVVQGLVQQGENPFAPGWSKVAEGRVVNASDLVMDQQLENGCWPNYNATLDDPFSTTDAAILLSQLVTFDPLYRQMMPLVSGS